MPTLYVANTTKQNHIFYYRDPDDLKRLRSLIIPMGGQMPVIRDQSMEYIHKVIEQHARYGMIPMGMAMRGPAQFVGLCYSIDDPVTKPAIEAALANNDTVLKERSDEMLEDSANAVKEQIDASVGRPARTVTVEMVEEADDPKLAKGFEVLSETVTEEQLQKVRQRRADRERGKPAHFAA